MTTNETIAKWLGLSYTNENDKIIHFDKITARYVVIDFLHSRDQQKWIIDELRKRGYHIILHISPESVSINVYKVINDKHWIPLVDNYSKEGSNEGQILIEAVLELIKKEETK